MESEKLGKAISFLRKREGYTQRELSELLDISDKAVSKWERGLSYPDISLLPKLSILLNTDIESMLQGNVSYCNQEWKGVMILDDSYENSAITQIYDKPMVYYLLSYFLLVGIREILVLCSSKDKKWIEEILSDGKKIGINLVYQIQNQIIDGKNVWEQNRLFFSGANIMVLYGKKFIYGVDVTKVFQRAMSRKNGVTLLTTQSNYGIGSKKIVFDMTGKILSEKEGTKKNLQEAYHTIPILFCTSEQVEKMILNMDDFWRLSDLNEKKKLLYAEMMGRGIVQYDLQNWDDIAETSAFVRSIQKKQNEYVSCIEEIAWRRGLISKKELKVLGEEKAGTEYGNYILNICRNG